MLRIRKLVLPVIFCLLLFSTGLSCGAEETMLMSGDLRFRMTLPEGWEDMAEELTVSRADRGMLIRCGDRKHAYFLVFGCEEASEELPAFEDFEKCLTEGITENPMFTDVCVLSPIAVTLKGTGLRGNLFPFTAQYEGIPVYCRIYTFEGVGEYLQFFAWSPGTEEASAGLVFDRIVNSLRIER